MGGLLSLGQNPKQKICYQTQVSLALCGYPSTKMRGILLDLREKEEPEESVEAGYMKYLAGGKERPQPQGE